MLYIALLLASSLFLFIGFSSLKKHQFNTEQFFIGTNKNSFLKIGFSLSATWIGAATMIVLSQWVITYGLGAIWYLIMPGIAQILCGFFLVKKIRLWDNLTLSELFSSPALKVFLSLTFYTIYFLIFSSQMVGFGRIFEMLGGNYTIGLLCAAIVITTYLSFSGFEAVKNTDFWQILAVIMVVILLVFNAGISIENFDKRGLLHPWQFLPEPLFFLCIMLFPLMFIAQDNHQRIKACATDSDARKSCILAGGIVISFAIIISLVSLNIGQKGFNSILDYVSQANPIFATLVALGLFAAALSTADSALNIAVVNASNIFNISSTHQLRIAVIATGFVGVALAYLIPSIEKIIFLVFHLYIALLFPIFIARIINSSIFHITIAIILTFIIGGYLLAIKNTAPGLWTALIVTSVILLFTGLKTIIYRK